MKKLSERQMIEDRFIVNQNQHRSEIGKYLNQRNIIFILFLVSMVWAALMSLQNSKLQHELIKARQQVVVFKEDGSGMLTFVGIANDKLDIDDKAVVMSLLRQYVIDLYTAPMDKWQKERNAERVVAMTDKTYFEQKVINIIRENYIENAGQSVDITINTYSQVNSDMGKNVWQFDFTKTDSTGKKYYTTQITFKQDTNIERGIKMVLNPLGIYVTNIQTMERIGQ